MDDVSGCKDHRSKFRSQTSDKMDRWKSRGGKSQGGEEKEVRRSKKRKREKKEDASAWKGRKVAIHCVFPMFCGSGGLKSWLAKAAGAEPAGQIRNEKLHTVVARSTFPSQNVQNKPGLDHFWKLRWQRSARCCGVKHICKSKCAKHTMFGRKLRCQKNARRCGAKHISKSKCTKQTRFGPLPTKLRWQRSAHCCGANKICKSKCTKHTMFRPLLEVAMAKKCMSLWYEAHFQVKMNKTHQVRTTFGSWDVEKSARRCGAKHISKSNMYKTHHVRTTLGSCYVEKSARRCGAKHISKSKV